MVEVEVEVVVEVLVVEVDDEVVVDVAVVDVVEVLVVDSAKFATMLRFDIGMLRPSLHAVPLVYDPLKPVNIYGELPVLCAHMSTIWLCGVWEYVPVIEELGGIIRSVELE